MSEQSFKNHSRYVFLFHFVTLPLALALVVGSIINLSRSTEEGILPASLLLLASLLINSIAWFSRQFALKAQDRAIRAEENVRHFILTGKPLDARLQMAQIVALRFSTDAEFPGLCQSAVEKNMKNSEIKKAIENWRPDHHRA